LFDWATFSKHVHHWYSNAEVMSPRAEDELADWWLRHRKCVGKTLRRGFDSLVVLVWWIAWKKERKARVFIASYLPRPPAQLMQLILEEGAQWVAAGFLGLAGLV
jgi:hypothetical protein